jgi:hypothetical protein
MIKTYGIFSVVNAFLFLRSPRDACVRWQFSKPGIDSPLFLTLMRMHGTVLATHGAACLVQSCFADKTALDTVAYGAATLGVTSALVWKDLIELKLKKPSQLYFGYMICCLGVAAYLLT